MLLFCFLHRAKCVATFDRYCEWNKRTGLWKQAPKKQPFSPLEPYHISFFYNLESKTQISNYTSQAPSRRRRFQVNPQKFLIVLPFRPHEAARFGFWIRSFFKPGPRVNKSEDAAVASPCVQSIRIFLKPMTPSLRLARLVPPFTARADTLFI